MQQCLACNSDLNNKILNFGLQPAANLLLDTASQSFNKIELALNFCDSCGHSQQAAFYPREELFSHYLYQSGTTKTLANFFDWLANHLSSLYNSNNKILEIACNDGSMLQALANHNLFATGIDPAKNLVQKCLEKNLNAIHAFWPCELKEKFDVVIALNVLAHGPNPLEFLTAIKQHLTANGIAVVQVSQADMFNNFEFDTLYHEHYSFFCTNSLEVLAKRAGFTNIKFVKTNIHGGSILAIIGNDLDKIENVQSTLATGNFALGKLSNNQKPTNKQAKIFKLKTQETCENLNVISKLAASANKKFVLVGVAAKAITLIQASKVSFDYVIDEAPLKIGKFIPNTSMKISSFDEIKEIEEDCIFLIGAWNFKEEIELKLNKLRNNKNDISLVCFPNFIMRTL